MSTQLSYYELLDLPTTASPDEIRSPFYGKCRRIHPDKNTQSCFSDEQWSEWSADQAACKKHFQTKRGDLSVIAMEKDQAIQDIKNMKFEYETSLEREKSKNCIVIVSALYGDLAGTRDKENDNGQIAGTGGVVGSVDNHKLIISSGTVKADIRVLQPHSNKSEKC